MKNHPEILDRLERGRPVRVTTSGGGCIARALVAEFADGSRVFVKSLENAPGMFQCEANGLRALAGAGAIRVPAVLAVDDSALVLEYIEEGPRRPGFSESFGRALARLHAVNGLGAVVDRMFVQRSGTWYLGETILDGEKKPLDEFNDVVRKPEYYVRKGKILKERLFQMIFL